MITNIIGLWAHPRSVSTAFERMMIQRGDFLVVHEPFNSLYDTGKSILTDPSGHEYTATSYEQIIDAIMEWSLDKQVFIKDTFEYHYEGLYQRLDFLEKVKHSFIIREPEQTINSHYALNKQLTLRDVGYHNLLDLIHFLDNHGIGVSAIIDADELLGDPVKIVTSYCSALGIPFLPEALRWESERKKEWERTEKWHLDAQGSQGFDKKSKTYPVRVDNSEKLKDLYQACLPHYQTILALKNEQAISS